MLVFVLKYAVVVFSVSHRLTGLPERCAPSVPLSHCVLLHRDVVLVIHTWILLVENNLRREEERQISLFEDT